MSSLVGDQWRISRAEQIRRAMGPDMCAVADVLRDQFGARLVWFETPKMAMGTEPEWGVPTQWRGERKRS